MALPRFLPVGGLCGRRRVAYVAPELPLQLKALVTGACGAEVDEEVELGPGFRDVIFIGNCWNGFLQVSLAFARSGAF